MKKSARSPAKPNIICFVMDRLRSDYLGFMGNKEISTPNLDHLAERGVVFDRAYSASPLCMPTRSTLFTGLMPREHGVRTNGIPLAEEIPTLPSALQNHGYRTHSIGKIHLSTFSLPNGYSLDDLESEDYPESSQMWKSGKLETMPQPYYGFESCDFIGGHGFGAYGDYRNWIKNHAPCHLNSLSREHPANRALKAPKCFEWAIPEELHYNHWIADRAIDFLQTEQKKETPFFLWCSFPDPHPPYAAPGKWGDTYDPASLPPPIKRDGELEDLPPFYKNAYHSEDTRLSGLFGSTNFPDEDFQTMAAIAYGMISFVDHEIGRVLSAVKELGIEEETIIVFMADHGDMMGDHWMSGLGPFHFEQVVRVPFVWSWPKQFNRGFRTESLTGHIDFAPTVLDLCGVPIPEGFTPRSPECENQLPPWPGESLKSVLKAGSKEPAKRDRAVIIEIDEDYIGEKMRTMVTERYKMTIYPGKPYGELFDLENDPHELYNLWDDPEKKSIKNELYQRFSVEYILHESALPRRHSHA